MNDSTATALRELLLQALPLTADSDTDGVDRNTLFTPTGHRRALEPDVTVVKGARGVGKTHWFKSLRDDQLREVAADEYQLPRLRSIEPLTGFGSALRPDEYPTKRTLSSFIREGVEPVDIWTAVTLNALGVASVQSLPTWRERLTWLQQNPEQVERELSRADEDAGRRGVTKLVMFDALDRLHTDRRLADRLSSGILEFALELRLSTRNIRAKVFIRHDMLDSAPLNFPDASKLTANTADLTWTNADLYGLLFQHIGNSDMSIAGWFREQTGSWQDRGDRRLPPRDLVGDRDAQSSAFILLAGQYMGTNHRKGHTYTWLPNHLADGNGQTSPRSFLVALSAAAEETARTHAGHHVPLHWDAIRRGVQRASSVRVDQVNEDIPWVSTAIRPLADSQVPIEQPDVIDKWRAADLTEMLAAHVDSSDDEAEDVEMPRAGPVNPSDYPKLIEELIALGVMTRRANGKLDLPDVYRIAFNIGRKGGVPRVKH
ncbi:hypothetical protein [Amycolatopsis magusensis]|uniref:hypothetical protein n=1 Tax=Amycolatopsis magusensis TaxID=882444 RepID=UPI003790239B